MFVYTVHPEFIYKIMCEQGYYEGSQNHIIWPEPYAWMVYQMKKSRQSNI